MDEKQLEFAIFCIESIAEHLMMSGDKVYQLLTKDSSILDSYILPCYDVLHTQGKSYIVNDLVEVMRLKGIVV